MSKVLARKPAGPVFNLVDADGTADPQLLPPLTERQYIEMYRWMKISREFDRRAVMMQRKGQLGTYPSLEGQEAAQIGSAFALRKEDMMFPTYRENGAAMVHGLPIRQILHYWNGRADHFVKPEGVNVFPVAVPIATQVLHAVGYAMADKFKRQNRATLVYFGDGATSKGDFHEGMNFAGVFRVPVVLFCQNNQYAISVPYHRQTASETIAEKADAYGVESIRVDGNDVLAVYQATKNAVYKAYLGEGPTLIEAVTYRYNSHTTADDHTRYRSSTEVEKWRTGRDPILRFRRFLERQGLWNENQENLLAHEIQTLLDEEIKQMKQCGPSNPLHMFEYSYQDLPLKVEEQRNEFIARRKGGGIECRK
ncbi:pyruvate dehydrogenase (acetyl-transferring) E1 component subunit alpha [Ferviditalea candida]|uniref:Pyruvate dehydrogenase E1 component subunit alpha n=1 Tax=Ferviditalea candida TaxID=3108399 RepID=A0ABU5ZMI8_9BACL|nr:pyruvate dehydrogenase (acetyl-transferring) E1 component subunit alpha [Paenibacillaceae bacterium T2]